MIFRDIIAILQLPKNKLVIVTETTVFLYTIGGIKGSIQSRDRDSTNMK